MENADCLSGALTAEHMTLSFDVFRGRKDATPLKGSCGGSPLLSSELTSVHQIVEDSLNTPLAMSADANFNFIKSDFLELSHEPPPITGQWRFGVGNFLKIALLIDPTNHESGILLTGKPVVIRVVFRHEGIAKCIHFIYDLDSDNDHYNIYNDFENDDVDIVT